MHTHGMLIKTKTWDMMCEMSATHHRTIVQSSIMIQRGERSHWGLNQVLGMSFTDSAKWFQTGGMTHAKARTKHVSPAYTGNGRTAPKGSKR